MARPGTGPRLYRRPGRPHWNIVWQGADGKPRRRSTGESDREAAARILARAVLNRGVAAPSSIAEILGAYVAERGPGCAGGEDQLRYPCQRLTDFFGLAGIDELTPARIRAYVAHRRAAKISDGTTRKELGALKAALRFALRSGMIEAVPHIALPASPGPRERWLSRAEARRLRAACKSPHLKLFVAIALATGARAGAILGLSWGQVDLARRLIEFNPPGRAQNNKRRTAVPINDQLAVALKAARKRATSTMVIEYRGKGVRSIKKSFTAAAVMSVLPGVTPHVLRHTAATWMAQAGVDLFAIGGVLAHRSPATTARYAKHHPDYLRAAVAALAPARTVKRLGPGMGQELEVTPGNPRPSAAASGHRRPGITRRKQPKNAR